MAILFPPIFLFYKDIIFKDVLNWNLTILTNIQVVSGEKMMQQQQNDYQVSLQEVCISTEFISYLRSSSISMVVILLNISKTSNSA